MHFATPPNPIQGGIEVIGQGLTATYLERDYQPGATVASAEFILVYDIGSSMRDLSLFAGRGTSNGIALHLIETDARRGGWNVFSDLYISGYGTYTIPVFLDGTLKVTQPKGARDITFRNVSIFNATSTTFECWNCINFQWLGGGYWQGAGTVQTLEVGGPLSTGDMLLINFAGVPGFWAGSAR